MNTTKIGTNFENRVFKLFSSLLKNDELSFVSQKSSKIFQHKKYQCVGYDREIDFDITIETYNPNSSQEEWSSLVVIECKCLSHTMDISDLDEFETKMKKVSDSGIKGIMVTTKGFSLNGIEQAKKSHIALMVLSEEQHNWIVSRDIIKSEQQMQILHGYNSPGLAPTIYFDNQFASLYEYLNRINVPTTDKNVVSIPWLKREEIKDKANELYQSCTISSNDVAGEVLAQQYSDIRINFADFPQGVLGALSFTDKIITLSNDLVDDVHRRNFTLAHELGHLYLHKPLLEKCNSALLDYEERFVANLPDEIIKRMEMQANLFASYLLIPQVPFVNEVARLFKEHSITTGRLYLDHQPCNKHDVYTILGALSIKFNVSKEAAKMRLLNEGLLIIDNGQPQRIDRTIRTYYR